MKNTEDHYMHMLDSHKLTGYMFKRIPMPPGTPIIFTLANVLLFALIGKVTHLELLMAIPCFAIVWEHYNVSLNRNMVLEDCVVNEIYMQYEFVQNGVDPNFPDDPIYVTDEDREDIFRDNLYKIKGQCFRDKLKSHHVFILIVVALYTLLSISF
jgi:hypothetical protein